MGFCVPKKGNIYFSEAWRKFGLKFLETFCFSMFCQPQTGTSHPYLAPKHNNWEDISHTKHQLYRSVTVSWYCHCSCSSSMISSHNCCSKCNTRCQKNCSLTIPCHVFNHLSQCHHVERKVEVCLFVCSILRKKSVFVCLLGSTDLLRHGTTLYISTNFLARNSSFFYVTHPAIAMLCRILSYQNSHMLDRQYMHL